MKSQVERNWIEVVGIMWMPACRGATFIELTPRDVEDIGEPTRENVAEWLTTHSGDFQKVLDFHAIVGEKEIPWALEENGFAFDDIQYGE